MAAKFRIISGGSEKAARDQGPGAGHTRGTYIMSKGDQVIASPNTKAAESRAAQTIREAFQSGRPLTYIRSAEEQRVGRVLREVAEELSGAAVWTWSLTEGLRRDGRAAEEGGRTARQALDFIAAQADAGIFHLKDFHEQLRDSPEIRRRLRDVYESCLDRQKFVVITSPVRFIPEEIERSVLFLEMRPPDVVELREFLREETKGVSEDTLQQIAGGLLGLTLDEARYALRRALAVNKTLG